MKYISLSLLAVMACLIIMAGSAEAWTLEKDLQWWSSYVKDHDYEELDIAEEDTFPSRKRTAKKQDIIASEITKIQISDGITKIQTEETQRLATDWKPTPN